MDLSSQKTFFRKGNTVQISICGLFKLKSNRGIDFMTLWMHDEINDSWQYCCRIDTLEELETEYNKRSNNIFAWK